MFKFLATSVLFAGMVATSPSHAQVGDRAYAPENISQLSVSDQVRGIENEYRPIILMCSCCKPMKRWTLQQLQLFKLIRAYNGIKRVLFR